MLTIGTGIGGGLIVDGRLYRGSTVSGSSSATPVSTQTAHAARATAPTAAASRRWPPAPRSPARAWPQRRRPPDSALGRALAEGVQLDGKEVTDAALAGDATARSVLREIGKPAGGRILQSRQHLRPGRDRDRRRREQGGELLAGPAREGARLPRPAADERDARDDRRARPRGGHDRGCDDGHRAEPGRGGARWRAG